MGEVTILVVVVGWGLPQLGVQTFGVLQEEVDQQWEV